MSTMRWMCLAAAVFGLAAAAGTDDVIVVNQLHEPEADCVFSVHNKGPQGVQVSGTSLNSELYYRIKCKPEAGYCLRVINCTVSTESDSQPTYAIIDEYGCTKEPSLFEHVEYEDDFTAGIYNPYPIRFRGDQRAAVRFACSTTLAPTGASGVCQRATCASASEFSREANAPPKRWRR